MKTNLDTLLIVLADRETGWLELNSWPLLDDDLLGNYQEENDQRARRIARTLQINATLVRTSHSQQAVPFHLYRKNAGLLVSDECLYNNALVYGVMRNAIDGTYLENCPAWTPGFGESTDGPTETSFYNYSTSITFETSTATPQPTSSSSSSEDSS